MSVVVSQSAERLTAPSASRLSLARVIGALKQNAYVGTFAVFLGAGLVTLNGRLISVALPDLRGALGFGVDEASWITTSYNTLFVAAWLGGCAVGR